MKLKTKLVSLCLAFAMVVGVLMVGVWAVRSTNFQVGGDIVFKANGIEATIAGATLSGASFTDGSSMDTKCSDITIDADTTANDLAEDYGTWKGLALQFDEDVATLKFTVTNTKQETSEYPFMSVDVSVNSTSISNAAVVVSNSNGGSKIYLAAGESADYTISFYINDNTADASVEGFTIDFAMERMVTNPTESSVQLSYDSTGNYYYVTMGTYTISGSATDVRWRLLSFDGENKFEVTKTTPPTMYSAVSGDTAYQDATFVLETVTSTSKYVEEADYGTATANDYSVSVVKTYLATESTTADGSSFIGDLQISTTNSVYQNISARSMSDLAVDAGWTSDAGLISDAEYTNIDDSTHKFWIPSVKELYTLFCGERVVDSTASSDTISSYKDSFKWCVNADDYGGVTYCTRTAGTTGNIYQITALGSFGAGTVNTSSFYVRPMFNLNF